MAVEDTMKSYQHFINDLNEMKNKGDGDCMVVAAQMLVYQSFGPHADIVNKDSILVHALVRGQGKAKGLRFAHAWVETGDTVYDYSNGNKIAIPKDVYYAIGGVKPKQKGAYSTYTLKEAKKKLLSTGHYGPWDLDENLEENNVSDPRGIGRKRLRLSPKMVDFLKTKLTEAIITGRPTTGMRTGGGVRSLAPAQAQEHSFVSWNDLKRLESMLDALFAQAGLDIAFTKHFWERINGSRGYGGTVSIPELQDAFRKTFSKYAQQIKGKSVNWKAIILDIGKDHLNMPFVLNWSPQEREMSIVALTAMKKRNFMASEPKLPV